MSSNNNLSFPTLLRSGQHTRNLSASLLSEGDIELKSEATIHSHDPICHKPRAVPYGDGANHDIMGDPTDDVVYPFLRIVPMAELPADPNQPSVFSNPSGSTDDPASPFKASVSSTQPPSMATKRLSDAAKDSSGTFDSAARRAKLKDSLTPIRTELSTTSPLPLPPQNPLLVDVAHRQSESSQAQLPPLPTEENPAPLQHRTPTVTFEGNGALDTQRSKVSLTASQAAFLEDIVHMLDTNESGPATSRSAGEDGILTHRTYGALRTPNLSRRNLSVMFADNTYPGDGPQTQGSRQSIKPAHPGASRALPSRLTSMLASPEETGIISRNATSAFLTDASIAALPYREEKKQNSSHAGGVYYVNEVRGPNGKPTFDPVTLALRINDSVVLRWWDSSHVIYETNNTFTKLIPGGRHSLTQFDEETTDTSDEGNEATDFRPTALVRNPTSGQMEYTIQFSHAGDYYFICTKNKKRMRLHVQIQAPIQHNTLKWVMIGFFVVVILIIIAVIVAFLAYWFQTKDWFLSRESATTEEQYEGTKQIQALITLHAFPWIAVGLILIIITLIALVACTLYFRNVRKPRGFYTRGVKTSATSIMRYTFIAVASIYIVLLFTLYGMQLRVTVAMDTFSTTLTSGLITLLNEFSTAVAQVNFVLDNKDELLPNISISTEDISSFVNQISDILNTTESWTDAVQDIIVGGFRIPPVLLFLVLQIGLFTAIMAIGGSLYNHRKALLSTVTLFALVVGLQACGCGVSWTLSTVLDRVYASMNTFETTDSAYLIAENWGFPNDSVVTQIFGACDADGALNGGVLADAINEVAKYLNDSFDEDEREQYGVILDIAPYLASESIDLLANYSGYIYSQLDLLNTILTNNPSSVDNLVGAKNAVTVLRVLVSVGTTLYGVVNCRVFRQILSAAIPVLQHAVRTSQNSVTGIYMTTFVLAIILTLLAAITTYAVWNKRRCWYHARSQRWFRNRFCYVIHRQVLLKGPTQIAMGLTLRERILGKAKPTIVKLINCKFVAFSASFLMFFDSILLALFSDLSRGMGRDGLIRAIVYLGCVQLLFFLFASLFHRVIIRRALHLVAGILILAIAVLAIVRLATGFDSFSKCLSHKKTYGDTSGYPFEISCPAAYLGYEVEKAIYATVVFLNCITLLVTLSIIIYRENVQMGMLQKRHYIGFYSPLEKRFPILAPIFADEMIIRRIYLGIGAVFIIIFLILIATLDSSVYHVISNVDNSWKDGVVTQVIDPTIGCNGNKKFCSMRVNELIWATTHNAHSSLENGFVVPNHYYNITRQLTAGIRAFMPDLWYDRPNRNAAANSDPNDSQLDNPELVYLCHEICLLGRTLLSDTLQEFKKFLFTYKKEVVIIMFEQYVNSSDVGDLFDEAGLSEIVWHAPAMWPNEDTDFVWPTIQELVDKNQRMLVFNDEMGNANASINKPDWLYYTYDFMFENSFTTLSTDQFRCDIGRGWCTANISANDGYDITNCTDDELNTTLGNEYYNNITGTNPPLVATKLATINHFVTVGIGSPAAASVANQQDSLVTSIDNCTKWWGQIPNIVAVDFWSIGTVLQTINTLNQQLASGKSLLSGSGVDDDTDTFKAVYQMG